MNVLLIKDTTIPNLQQYHLQERGAYTYRFMTIDKQQTFVLWLGTWWEYLGIEPPARLLHVGLMILFRFPCWLQGFHWVSHWWWEMTTKTSDIMVSCYSKDSTKESQKKQNLWRFQPSLSNWWTVLHRRSITKPLFFAKVRAVLYITYITIIFQGLCFLYILYTTSRVWCSKLGPFVNPPSNQEAHLDAARWNPPVARKVS